MRATVLLGINCGFGNNDCATLTFKNLDLEGGWHSHPRPKTSVPRRCPLWSETVGAIRDWLKVRPKPRDPAHADLVFLTSKGLPFIRPAITSQNNLAAGRLDHLYCQDSLGNRMLWTLKHLGIKAPGFRSTACATRLRRSAAQPKTKLPLMESWGMSPPAWEQPTAIPSMMNACEPSPITYTAGFSLTTICRFSAP